MGLGLGQRCSVLAFISSIMAAMYLGATSHTLRTSSSRVSKESEIHTEGAWVSATCVAEGWRLGSGASVRVRVGSASGRGLCLGAWAWVWR